MTISTYMSNKSLFIVLAACVVLLDSCAYKRLTYFQDMEPLTTYEFNEAPDTRIRKGDKIKIYVTSSTPELTAPFNLSSTQSAVDLATGIVNLPENANSVTAAYGTEYLVEKDGTIAFPLLGSIVADGKTLGELKDHITGLIKSRGYVKDPVVDAEFTNFKVTVLGEMSTGIYYVSGSTTVLEMIARSRLNESAIHEDIWVIRQDGNRKKVYSIDLTTKECFNSPAFYLQQDDILYAKPRKNRLDSSVTQFTSYLALAMTAISTVTMILVWTGMSK